jgi:hypothetical protein
MARGRQARLQIGGDATALHTAALMMRVSFLLDQKTDKDLEWTGAKLREHKQMYLMGVHCTGLESAFTIRRLTGLDRKMCVVGSLDAPFTLAKEIDQEAIVLMFRCISFAPKGAATN